MLLVEILDDLDLELPDKLKDFEDFDEFDRPFDVDDDNNDDDNDDDDNEEKEDEDDKMGSFILSRIKSMTLSTENRTNLLSGGFLQST